MSHRRRDMRGSLRLLLPSLVILALSLAGLKAAGCSSTPTTTTGLITTAGTTSTTSPAFAVLQPFSTGVPSGVWLEQIETTSEIQYYYLIDFTNKRMRWEDFHQGKLQFVTIINKAHTVGYDNLEGRPYPTSDGDFDEAVAHHPQAGIDTLAGSALTKVDEKVLDGKQTDVYRVAYHDPADDPRADYCYLAYIDRQTGLRVREEWTLNSAMTGKVTLRVITRQLVTPTPALEIGFTVEPSPDFAPLLGPSK